MSMRGTSRRNFIRMAGLGAAALPLAGRLGAQRSVARRPNVILIYLDDVSFQQVGCWGGPAATPNIDRMAREGMRFERFYVTSAVCTPSRYSVLTGRFASRSPSLREDYPHGGPVSLTWNTFIDPDERTLAKALKRSGYRTGMVGKWHLSPFGSKPHRELPETFEPGTAQARELEQRYRGQTEDVARRGGFDFVDGLYYTNLNGLNMPEPLRRHNVEWQLDSSLRFIGDNRGEPFFLYWATPIIHSPNPLLSIQADPRVTPRGYLDRAPDVGMPTREELIDELYMLGTIDPREDGGGWWEAAYGTAGMTWLDHALGVLLQRLEQWGIAGDTMIVLASDNGYQRGKNTCYEAGVNVPALVYWPGRVPGGAVCSELASNVDIAPTVLEACGAGGPESLARDGVSLLPLVDNPRRSVRESIFCEVGHTRAVVTRDWKYIAVRYPEDVRSRITDANRGEFSHDGTRDVGHRFGAHVYYPGYFDYDQLYDLDQDPVEQVNLAGRYRSQLAGMQGMLERYSKSLPHLFGEFS